MLAVCRGRISAIILCACAAIMGAKVSAQNTSASQTVATVGEDLLRHSENPRSLDVHSLDVQWMLQDSRQAMLNGAFPADHVPLPKELTRQTTSLLPARPDALPHVNAPSSEDSTSVNDRLVPVPVVSTSWAIILCAVMFNIGARVLRFRRAANS
jgi:hypothetical protein